MPNIEILRNVAGMENVSCETFCKLEEFVKLLLKWNQKINLVSKKITETELWQRHILDSAQLIKYIPQDKRTIIDFGSGAGLPGIILAIMREYKVTLVESDQKKCAFLNEASVKLKLNTVVLNKRIEEIELVHYDVITSRALAALPQLLSYSHVFLDKDNFMLFLKGQNMLEEIKEASKNWEFSYEIFPDAINKEGGVLKISNVRNMM